MATFSDDDRFADLLAALTLVAADAEAQLALLPALRAIAAQIRGGQPAGELIDETLVREGVLPPGVGAQIEHIDALFDRLLADGGDLSADTLTHAPEWKQMRAAAREALSALGMRRRRTR